MLDRLTALIKKAKIQRNTHLLEKVHETILDFLHDLRIYKKKNRKSETYQLNDEITKLEELNCIVFEVFADIERNAQLIRGQIKLSIMQVGKILFLRIVL